MNRYGEKRAFRRTEEEVGDERGGFISAVKDVDFPVFFLTFRFSNVLFGSINTARKRKRKKKRKKKEKEKFGGGRNRSAACGNNG